MFLPFIRKHGTCSLKMADNAAIREARRQRILNSSSNRINRVLGKPIEGNTSFAH